MAKGYPARRARGEDAPDFMILDDVIGEGTCVICKRRPSQTRGMCSSCYAALHPGESA